MELDPTRSSVSSRIGDWAVIYEPTVDISFLQRQHRRRLSTTTRLALTAYYRCNPELTSCRTVFASRYGEYSRTFGILEAIARSEPASPAAFSVSVHNTPSGILGIATENTEPSSTIAATQSTIEAGYLEAAMQQAELGSDHDIIFVYVDEPLPELYGAFRGSADVAYAFGLRLAANGTRQIRLSWSAGETASPRAAVHGVPGAGLEIVKLLERGHGCHSSHDERLRWEWAVE
jgi:hypothetical protein